MVSLEVILANHQVPQKGKSVLHQHCVQLRWGAADRCWGEENLGVPTKAPVYCQSQDLISNQIEIILTLTLC